MAGNLHIDLGQQAYNALMSNPLTAIAKSDPLFGFDDTNYRVEIRGEFRELTANNFRMTYRRAVNPDLQFPEKAIEKFATPAYKALTKQRRDQARADLRNVAPPGGAAIGPPAGVTGDMDATQAGQHMLANGGGFVLGYEHDKQDSKDATTEIIQKAGGTDLKHIFLEELSSGLQAEIDAFLSSPAAEMPPNLLKRIKALQESNYHADFEPMLYAAREKGVKVWGIDSPEADPQVDKSDPRYHERRLVLMNAEAKRVYDHVHGTYPGEPFMAMTGRAHVNTAEGGVPGLAQIMGVPGVNLDPGTKRLAFLPEDTSKRAAVNDLERECSEAILKQAATDYKAFYDGYPASADYKNLPDPKPDLDSQLNLLEATAVAQRVVAQFVAAGRLNASGDIAGLMTDPAVNAALQPIYKANITRHARRKKLNDAIKKGELPKVQSALDEDPYLVKMSSIDEQEKDRNGDTLLHLACEAGHPTVVQELVTRGVNPNATDLSGRAPIHTLLGQRPSPKPASDLAAMAGHLLAGGANPNLADPTGKTGLALAKTGPLADSQLVEKFVTAGAAPATDLFVSKFVAAAKAGYAAVKQPGGVNFDEEEVRQAATTLAGSLPGSGVPLGNPGQVTTAMGNAAVTAELARLTQLFVDRAVRMQAAAQAIETKDLGKLQTALNADPRLAHIPIDGDHMALALAAYKGDNAALDELIGRGVSADQKNPRGRTALHELLSAPWGEVGKTSIPGQQAVTAKAQELISRGADVNARNGGGQTAMHLAGFRNNGPLITALKALTSPPAAAVPDLTARDNRGWTPMDTAMGGTNREAEDLLHPGAAGQAPPLKAGQLSTVDILAQATMCEDPADAHKARKFIEKLYANADLRPMLHLAAAAACNNHKPPNGGLRLFASKSNTVGALYDRVPGATAAYDQKVNSLLFPMEDGQEGEAVGSLAHELTHFTAHLVTNNPATLPFSAGTPEEAQYRAAIAADVRKVHLLDDSDPVQKFIKGRFSGRMDSYQNEPGSPPRPRTGPEFDEALLQEFIVGVPQVAAVYGMDALEKHLPNLVGYYKNVWTPKMNQTLAADPRLAAGRAKIDSAADATAAAALSGHPGRQPQEVQPVKVKKGDARLNLDTLMAKVEKDFAATKGNPKAMAGGRTVIYQLDDLELTKTDKDDFEKKKSTIRAALKSALAGDNFPPDIDLNEIRALVETVTVAVKSHSGGDLKTALNNRTANWVKGAKRAYVDRQIRNDAGVTPKDLAEAIAYRAEAEARKGVADADLDPDTEVKASKQKDLINGLTKSLGDPANAKKLRDQAGRLLDEISATLSNPAASAVYMKAGATTHVSMDVKKAKSEWLAKLATIK